MDLRLQDIAAAAADRTAFERGQEYYGQNRVSKLRFEPDSEGGGTKVTADVRGGKYSYEVEITLGEDGSFKEGWCDCAAFYESEGCCKHIVAVLLSCHYHSRREAAEKAASQNLPTDGFAAKMLNAYAKKRLGEATAKSGLAMLRLEPSLEYDFRGNFSLSFSIGEERLYLVKSIDRFYVDLMSGNTVEYGSKLTVRHDTALYEPLSKELLDFFLSKYRESENLRNLLGAPRQKSARRSLLLTPSAFDGFFRLYEGRHVPLRLRGKNLSVTLNPENPKIRIEVHRLGDAFLIDVAETVLFFFGEKNVYLLKEDQKLYRCDKAFTAAARDLFYALSEKGESLVVQADDMGAFCADVLGSVGDYAVISADGCDLSEYEPAPMTPRLYLDMPQPGIVTAELRFCYGETEIRAGGAEAAGNIRRDLRRETLAKASVEKYTGPVDPERGLALISDEERIFTLLTDGLPDISMVSEIYTTDSLRRVSVKKPPAVSVGVRLSGGLLDVQFDCGNFPAEELLELLDSYKLHKRFHKLRDGSFISLDDSSTLTGVSELVKGLDLRDEEIIRGRASVHSFRAMYIDGILQENGLLQSDRDAAFKAMLREVKDVDDADIQPPPELKKVLRNYQKKGFRWLRTMGRFGFGGILADDMGLGKTVQAIAYLQSLKDQAVKPRPSLVVCPASLVLNWESEITRFAPRLRVMTVIGPAQQRAETVSRVEESDVIVTSYELLKRDLALYEEIRFDCEILDEAQFIKNANTLSAKAVKSIESDGRFALTGTPIENSLAELWSIFDFLMPGYLYSHRKFREEYEIPIMRSGDRQASERLRKLTAPFILRRLKSTVLRELPPKTETVTYAPLEGEQAELYAAVLAEMQRELSAGRGGRPLTANRIVVLSMLTRLRQICCDPSLCFEDYTGGSAKLELCMELLKSSTGAGHKVLVFSQFTSMLSILSQRLSKEGIRSFTLRGSTSKEERARLISLFNSDDTPVFLISLRAGGTGLNLTAADIVIHYDPWWNLSVQNQATDRAHRIGQKNSVQVYKLIMKDTVEEKIMQLQEEKKKLADDMIGEGEGGLSSLDENELMKLLGL